MYSEEKAIAREFLKQHKLEPIILKFVDELNGMKNMLHSDRWSYIYDFISNTYGRIENFSCIVTGLTYLSEERELRDLL